MPRYVAAILTAILLLLNVPAVAAQTGEPWRDASRLRRSLADARKALILERAEEASEHVAMASAALEGPLAQALQAAAPTALAAARSGIAEAQQALTNADSIGLAQAQAQVWSALLEGSYAITLDAATRGDVATAGQWLLVREFRTATRFSRPGADATLALQALDTGSLTPAQAAEAIRADLLDTYQARLLSTLAGIDEATGHGFATTRAEQAAMARGYWRILAPAYAEQRGDAAASQTSAAFDGLVAAAVSTTDTAPLRKQIDSALQGFRAAPLDAAEQERRAGQLLRFLGLVPVEYARGVRGGRVTSDIEIQEAVTFHAGSVAAFNDLRPALEARDQPRTAEVARLLDTLGEQLAAAAQQSSVAAPGAIQDNVDHTITLLQQLLPEQWLRRNNAADFDVIAAALDQMEAAVVAGQYERAETARLEAYAILESGPEAKLVVFAPQHKPIIEGLFWYGHENQVGLAALIANDAPAATIGATRKVLDGELALAQRALAGDAAPTAVAVNAAVIVFREGLEAVLILASLMGSLKIGPLRRLRRPLWVGAWLALAASGLTWLLAQGALSVFAAYGEKLEAVVSLVAIAVLLLITNWFFHDAYWTGWMAGFHARKRQVIGGDASQWLGLVTLGFTSIYREGFETVLFLQALVLESGIPTVLGGVALGLAGTLLIGVLVFAVQTKLPHKKMLIATGILIGAVLLQMVGNTVHLMQVVGWMPLHPIRWLTLPYWAGFWFGLYATWEGILLQGAAAGFVIGSYYLAEQIKRRSRQATISQQAQTSS